MFSVYLGVKLGFYAALKDAPATMARAGRPHGIAERYVREWLEQQAVTGILEVETSGGERRFSSSPEHAEVLLDRDSLNYVAPIVQLQVGAVSPLPALLEAYRTGGGVPYADYGLDLREGQSEINRPGVPAAASRRVDSGDARHRGAPAGTGRDAWRTSAPAGDGRRSGSRRRFRPRPWRRSTSIRRQSNWRRQTSRPQDSPTAYT